MSDQMERFSNLGSGGVQWVSFSVARLHESSSGAGFNFVIEAFGVRRCSKLVSFAMQDIAYDCVAILVQSRLGNFLGCWVCLVHAKGSNLSVLAARRYSLLNS